MTRAGRLRWAPVESDSVAHGNLRGEPKVMENQVTTVWDHSGSLRSRFAALAQYFTEGGFRDVFRPDFSVLRAGLSALHVLFPHQSSSLYVDALVCASSGSAVLACICRSSSRKLARRRFAGTYRPAIPHWRSFARCDRTVPDLPSFSSDCGRQSTRLLVESGIFATAYRVVRLETT